MSTLKTTMSKLTISNVAISANDIDMVLEDCSIYTRIEEITPEKSDGTINGVKPLMAAIFHGIDKNLIGEIIELIESKTP